MFLHLITLCIGLLIAAGLQQIYEFLQRRRRTRALLEAERKASPDPLPPQDPPPTSQP
jgi:hypothetical protein